MSGNTGLYRKIPKVDDILNSEAFKKEGSAVSHAVFMDEARSFLEELREKIKSGELSALPETETISSEILKRAEESSGMSVRPVVNGTGVILHTNLGRARLSEEIMEAVKNASINYSTLEYDIKGGKRGSRYAHVEGLLTRITGAESALVVNNNAAAVLLVLSSMTKGKEVIISRGELVEIGGSFRVPDVMEQSGSFLKEVGTTNKTHLYDYENAVSENTGAFLKVHTSNFKMLGFTEDVSLAQLVETGKKYGLPVIYDLGSGSIFNLESCGIADEPNVIKSVCDKADIICFSGDKLLGGPQAGIIIGKKEYIEKMKKNPLTRALRIDKMTLAALEATLRIYRDPKEAKKRIPTLSMLFATADELFEKACALKDLILLSTSGYNIEVTEEKSQVGGGSVPTELLESRALAITPESFSVELLEERLRCGETPIIGRIAHGTYLLDVRTIDRKEFSIIAEALKRLI